MTKSWGKWQTINYCFKYADSKTCIHLRLFARASLPKFYTHVTILAIKNIMYVDTNQSLLQHILGELNNMTPYMIGPRPPLTGN